MATPSVKLLHDEVFAIVNCLLVIEQNTPSNDPRAFTCIDVCEALRMMDDVITARLSEELDDWKPGKNVEKHSSLFCSIKEQVKTTIELAFNLGGRKPPRFVYTFNQLFIERYMQWLKLIGPSGALEMSPIIVLQLIHYIEELDEEAQPSIDVAKKSLYSMRHALNEEHRRDSQTRMWRKMLRKAFAEAA